MARALGLRYDARALVSVPSPDPGFSVRMLADLSQELGLGLVPVFREDDDELVVPSVVHWMENHYAAIVERVLDEGGGYVYKVIDPTFGDPRFLTAETINLGASGVFLVPSRTAPPAWRPITDAEARQIFGRGNPNIQGDSDDQSCDQPFGRAVRQERVAVAAAAVGGVAVGEAAAALEEGAVPEVAPVLAAATEVGRRLEIPRNARTALSPWVTSTW